jgi:hypothetical protein
MPAERVDEILLTRYLLGKLSDEEQVRVEDRAFADPQYLRVLEAAEADLIDAYVRGELSEADRRAFEGRFLTSPERRGKVEFAQALARVTDEAPRVAPEASGWRRVREWFPAWKPVLALAGAAAFAGVSWLAIENAGMRSRISDLQAERQAMNFRAENLKKQLAEAQARGVQAPPAEGRTPLIASLVLMGGVSRAESRVERLVLEKGTQVAHIAIQLEARDSFSRYRAELRTRSGRDVVTLSDLRPERGTVSTDLPASVLTAGEYELALKGIGTDQTAQDLGYYYFRVERR